MDRMKWVGKWLVSWAVFVILFMITGMLFPLAQEVMAKVSPEENKYLALAIVVVTLCETFLLNYVIGNSKITGVRLFGAMLVLTWGLQTFMMQIETLLYIKAFPDLDAIGVLKLMLQDLLKFAASIPFIMLLHGKWKKSPDERDAAPVLKRRWYKWLPVISLTYLVLYYSFGMFPISFPEVKEYYAPWIASLGKTSWLVQLSVQLLRGVLWCVCVLPLFWILKGSKERKMTLAAVFMAVFTALQLMYPNGLMPPMVRLCHFAEIFVEMLIFGALTGWMVVAEDIKSVDGKTVRV